METKNQRYENKQKSRGLKKVTLWIPEHSEVELRQTIDFLCSNTDHVPYMARSIKTGKFKKIV